jgi:DNA-binding NarL/FixJ family response regulator
VKKIAIIPLVLINHDRQEESAPSDSEIGALILGLLDGEQETNANIIEGLQNALDSGSASSAFQVLDHADLDLISSIFEKIFRKQNRREIEFKTEPDVLSKREKEILQLIAQGYSNKEIAEQLFLSVKTIETHRRSIYRKLGLKNRVQATSYAIHHGLV